jgi:hypothetical protein
LRYEHVSTYLRLSCLGKVSHGTQSQQQNQYIALPLSATLIQSQATATASLTCAGTPYCVALLLFLTPPKKVQSFSLRKPAITKGTENQPASHHHPRRIDSPLARESPLLIPRLARRQTQCSDQGCYRAQPVAWAWASEPPSTPEGACTRSRRCLTTIPRAFPTS